MLTDPRVILGKKKELRWVTSWVFLNTDHPHQHMKAMEARDYFLSVGFVLNNQSYKLSFWERAFWRENCLGVLIASAIDTFCKVIFFINATSPAFIQHPERVAQICTLPL